ncbi:MAG TPA: hypothetical protein VKP68_02480 [Ramlibacter sp.]|nr:hypothetical protein [Ramlibacter sp.]
MNDAAAFKMAGAGEIATRDRQLVALWAVAVLLAYAVFGYFAVHTLENYAVGTRALRASMAVSPTVGAAPAASPAASTSGPASQEVLVGARLNRISDVAPTEGAWTADFTLWFRWDDPALSPGKDFGLVNGQIIQQDKLTSVARGATRYEEYHVVARMSQAFDALRFPFGEDVVVVRIEDKGHGVDRLRFVADRQGSTVAPEGMPPNLDLSQPLVAVKTRVVPPRPAEPDSASVSGDERSRSQFIFGAVLEPKGLNIALRLFQALLVSVAVALLALFIKPIMIDCRFGLPIGAFFAAVSNNSMVSSVVPRAAGRTLSDMVTTLSLLTIFLVLVQSVIALYVFDTLGREQVVRKFDRISFVVILVGFLVVGVLLPLAAQGR